MVTGHQAFAAVGHIIKFCPLIDFYKKLIKKSIGVCEVSINVMGVNTDGDGTRFSSKYSGQKTMFYTINNAISFIKTWW